ncbi:recombinase family protein [Bacteroides zhangwenhongii]|jgi:site-specific DNA recombinase|uniref:recombinase family protein n=1 Tax=Bacteroides zhangwenhongii TaxID=2650157 RepID=UPI0022E9074C|nr:recombinase family protein [Bacteroides zhangwenhongii]
MAKCILLVRVSTESKKQEISLREQETELFELALSKGYCEEDIIAICKQESALKRRYATSDEKDAIEIKQQGLQEMEDAIKNDSSINCVFAWEISRISRREKVLFDELEFLTDRKIQLVILKPYIELLNSDGSLNPSSKMQFSMFAALADAEMRNKSDRFRRTKESRRKEGKYVGGWLPFGYMVEPTTKKIIINEEEAAIVKYMFNEYLKGGTSIYKLANELQERGIISYDNKHSAFTFAYTILRNYSYAGLQGTVRQKDRKPSTNVYPAIVTKEMIDKAIEMSEQAKTKPKTNVKNIYYCKSLLKCADCERVYVARLNKAVYQCTNDNGKCNNAEISINLADTILWNVAMTLKISQMLHQTEEDKTAYQLQIEVLKQKIEKINIDIENNNKAYSILNKRIIMQKISEEDGELIEKELDSTKKELEKKLNEYNNKVAEIEQILFNMNTSIAFKHINIDDIADIEDDNLRYEIIHEIIDYCMVEKVANSIIKLELYAKHINTAYTYYVTTRNRKIYNKDFRIEEAYTSDNTHLVDFKILQRYKRQGKANKEYQKQYYQKNREKLIKQNVEAKRRRKSKPE